MSILFPTHRYHSSFFDPLALQPHHHHHHHHHPANSAFGPSPFSLFNHTFNELSRWADESQQLLLQRMNASTSSFGPNFNFSENEDGYVIETRFPGAKRDGLTVEFADKSTLVVRGRTESVGEAGTGSSLNVAEMQSVGPAQGVGASDAVSQSSATESEVQKSKQARVEDENEVQSEQAQDSSPTPKSTQPDVPALPTDQEVVTQSSATSAPTQTKPQHRWTTSRTISSFQRTFSFPENGIDHDAVKASLKDGVLKIEVPKIKRSETGSEAKKVEIVMEDQA